MVCVSHLGATASCAGRSNQLGQYRAPQHRAAPVSSRCTHSSRTWRRSARLRASVEEEAGQPASYVLVSEDDTELLAAEVERLAAENAALAAMVEARVRRALACRIGAPWRALCPRFLLVRQTTSHALRLTHLQGSAGSIVARPGVSERDVSVAAVASDTVSPSAGEVLDSSESALELDEGGDAADADWGTADVQRSIVFVTSEVSPWSKTGGLADVAGALPVALAKRGHRVMVVAPRYLNFGPQDRLYDGAFDTQCRIRVGCFGGNHEVGYFHQFKDGVDYVFVDHGCFHRPGGLYGDQSGAYGDNMFRFTLLSHAACEAPLVLPLGGFTYGQKVIFLANDWHASLVPPLIASKYRVHGVYREARCIFQIHNLLHQGVEPIRIYPALGLPAEWGGALKWVYPEHMRKHALDTGETVNLLKGAVVTADRVMTVSSNYAHEITTPEGGCGLDAVLCSRASKLDGVVNGIDLQEWNPRSDAHLPATYSLADLSGKAVCKAALQKELGLPVRPDVPLIGFIGRLDWQKGPELIQEAFHSLMQQDVQVVMLGAGRWDLQDFLKWAEAHHRDKFRGWVGFNVGVSHRITAGADILLMPSKFEPCGLNQLYAMRYGTVPVVHATGGLKDTVQHYNHAAPAGPELGTGFLFWPANGGAMMGALNAATRLYREQPDRWRLLQENGMRRDASWGLVATRYEQIFSWAMMDPPYA